MRHSRWERTEKMNMKKIIILPLLSIVALANASASETDCLDFYENEAKAQKSVIKEIEDKNNFSKYGPFLITSSGIPNAIDSSKISTQEAKLDDLNRVADILKEAKFGGGIELIRLRKDLSSTAKVDLDTLAAAVRDANKSFYFCNGHDLATYDEVKTIMENLLTP